jgi:hypothetical protein
VPPVSSVAGMMHRAEFFAPLTVTSPASGLPPRTTITSNSEPAFYFEKTVGLIRRCGSTQPAQCALSKVETGLKPVSAIIGANPTYHK